ncbi:hypothetical protein [Nocardia cyriacigeorgica]|uniref:hypothetical protein n=1 Tax=Nocardia cyriacigeorgica TaxID=135487 RepID=UPI000CEA3BD5|nr:hypothetical protein [Nocardia cyriacigeorgica]PPJ03640.1 hypothetical protein C5E43_24960 [Nocardia cyriacigeorgica]
MRALVVFESVFGSTAAVARAVARGLGRHGTVELVDVAAAPATRPTLNAGDLLVVGGPTHAFGMSRVRTRRRGAERTGDTTVIDTGIREWLADAPPAEPMSYAATFATRAAKPRWVTGSAAHGAAHQLRLLGFELIAGPEDFLVAKTSGPLLSGELERATRWADRLGQIARPRMSRPY